MPLTLGVIAVHELSSKNIKQQKLKSKYCIHKKKIIYEKIVPNNEL